MALLYTLPSENAGVYFGIKNAHRQKLFSIPIKFGIAISVKAA